MSPQVGTEGPSAEVLLTELEGYCGSSEQALHVSSLGLVSVIWLPSVHLNESSAPCLAVCFSELSTWEFANSLYNL